MSVERAREFLSRFGMEDKIITFKRVKIGITIALGLALIAGIVIFAVIAFGGQGK